MRRRSMGWVYLMAWPKAADAVRHPPMQVRSFIAERAARRAALVPPARLELSFFVTPKVRP